MKHHWQVLLWILLCELIGVIGAVFTVASIPTWYASLIKPVFSPPNWLFGPVWTLLYALLGIAGYVVWIRRAKKKGAHDAMRWFFINLFFNALWSPVFFGMRNIVAGYVLLSIIWITCIFMIDRFTKIDKISAYLVLPYFVWVSFATVLSFNIWLLNPM